MTRAEKQANIAAALIANPGWSNRRIAAHVGVDGKTVAVWRGRMIVEGKLPYSASHLIGRDGRCHPVRLKISRQAKIGQREIAAKAGAVPRRNRTLWLLGLE